MVDNQLFNKLKLFYSNLKGNIYQGQRGKHAVKETKKSIRLTPINTQKKDINCTKK